MKKEQAFEAMKNGAIISHITWAGGTFIRLIDAQIIDESGEMFCDDYFDYLEGHKTGWVVKEFGINYKAEQLLKAIPLHLEDPNRVWCYSGHEAEPGIAKAIRELHSKVRMHDDYIKALEDGGKHLSNEVERLEAENESLKAGFRVDVVNPSPDQIDELLNTEKSW